MHYKELCAEAETSATSAKQVVKLATADYKKTKKPIYLALNGLGNFFMAKHAFNPISKLSYFKDGRKMIDGAIALEPDNLEMRFLRYVSQNEMPKILGYYGNKAEDKSFILKHYKNAQNTALKNEIINYLDL